MRDPINLNKYHINKRHLKRKSSNLLETKKQQKKY